jgi:hypothetical protein
MRRTLLSPGERAMQERAKRKENVCPVNAARDCSSAKPSVT